MKRAFLLLIASAALFAQTTGNTGEGRFNIGITITTSGTPVRIVAQSLKVDRLMIQADPANTGTVTVMLGVPIATACNSSSPSQISGKLKAGISLSDPQGANGNAPSEYEDLQYACVDSTVNGDVVIVTGWRRN